MTERLDRIETILADLAESHRASDERLTRIEALTAENARGLADVKLLTESNARAIEAWANQQVDERDEAIGVELDTRDQIVELRTEFYNSMSQVNDAINRMVSALITLLQRSA